MANESHQTGNNFQVTLALLIITQELDRGSNSHLNNLTNVCNILSVFNWVIITKWATINLLVEEKSTASLLREDKANKYDHYLAVMFDHNANTDRPYHNELCMFLLFEKSH